MREASFTREAGEVGIGKWQAEGVSIYATFGGSDYAVDDQHRTEFFCGLRPDRDDIASPLAALALYGIEHDAVLGHGDTVPAGGPTWPGSDMTLFLLVKPIEGYLDPAVLPTGVHVVFLQAIPLHESELEPKRAMGVDALLALWEDRGIAFWNPDRKPFIAEREALEDT